MTRSMVIVTGILSNSLHLLFSSTNPHPFSLFPWKTRHLGDRRPRWTFLVTLACRLYTLTPAATRTKVHHYLIQLHPTAIASYGHIRHSTLVTCYTQPDYPNRQLSTTPPSGPFPRRHKALRTLSFHRVMSLHSKPHATTYTRHLTFLFQSLPLLLAEYRVTSFIRAILFIYSIIPKRMHSIYFCFNPLPRCKPFTQTQSIDLVFKHHVFQYKDLKFVLL